MRKLTSIALTLLAASLMGNATAADDAKPAVGFKTHRIGDYRGEACGVGDFNKDGKLDIVALPFLYLAPEFKATKICEIAGEVDAEGKGYRDDFMNAPLDVDGDGWLDVITVTWFAKKAEWLRNPGAEGGLWPRNLIAEAGNFEAGSLADVDGDGKIDDLLPDTQDTAWYEHRDGAFVKHVVSAKPMTWGVGCGDVNGDGRPDIIRPKAWFEGPADPRTEEWKEHPIDIVNRDKQIPDVANILVHDVNADGLPDLIASAAHDYGVFWYEQVRQENEITFKRHLIDDTWSQAHSLAFADLDNDGAPELIAAKRFMAHNGTDPGELEPPCVYWYDLTQKPEPTWTRGTVSNNEGIGSGLNIATADLDADGDQDIIVNGKWGGPAWFENTLK